MSLRGSPSLTLFGIVQPRVRRTSTQVLPGLAILLIVTLSAAGCSSSAPRFRPEAKPHGGVIQEDDEFYFASRIRAEESREDDKKVDLKKITRDLTRKTSINYSNKTPEGLDRDKVLLNVVGYLGVPYEFGGLTKDGIDCSGFTSRVYREAMEKPLPRSTRDQFGIGKAVGQAELQFGDLVFFNTTGRGPSHVGLYIEDDLFAHASVTFGVTISSLESSYYRNRFIGARRLIGDW